MSLTLGNLQGEDPNTVVLTLESLDQADFVLVQIGVLRGYLISGSRAGTIEGWNKSGELVKEVLKNIRGIFLLNNTAGEASIRIGRLQDQQDDIFLESPLSNRGFNQGILLADTLEGEWRREKAKAEGELGALFLEQPVAVLREMARRSAQGTFSAADREVMDLKFQALSISWSRVTGMEKTSGNILTPESAASEYDWWAAQK